MSSPATIALLGASGYTGAELLRLLVPRTDVRCVALSAERNAGNDVGTVWPHLAALDLPKLCKVGDIDFSGVDFAFCALPHGTTQEIVARLPTSVRVVDLSADFRLTDPAVYQQWYGKPHAAVALQADAVYGLTEFARDEVKDARLVANPGCYPTAAQLALVPLLQARAIEAEGLIIDAKSGISGAGRDGKTANLYAEVTEGFQAYSIAQHRHLPEIEQQIGAAAGRAVTLTFTPHLVPMSRGIFETIYVRARADATELRRLWQTRYANEPFAHVLDAGKIPNVKQVRGTNMCQLAAFDDRVSGRVILLAAIDNLVKGAAGQAVQNMNVMMGIPETTGLIAAAAYP
jgi:N-acetyl-gamma-glutamyl-phosphate reductase